MLTTLKVQLSRAAAPKHQGALKQGEEEQRQGAQKWVRAKLEMTVVTDATVSLTTRITSGVHSCVPCATADGDLGVPCVPHLIGIQVCHMFFLMGSIVLLKSQILFMLATSKGGNMPFCVCPCQELFVCSDVESL